MRRLIRQWPDSPPLVLVTHQVNIMSLTAVYPQSGEIVVLRPEENRIMVVDCLRTLE